MTDHNRLYGLTTEPLTDMNQRAHQGGGTETVEVSSGEGLVEDQYEAHLKNLYVAFREPSAVKMAELAIKLEKAGFVELAGRVDEVLAGFYDPELTKMAELPVAQPQDPFKAMLDKYYEIEDLLDRRVPHEKFHIVYINFIKQLKADIEAQDAALVARKVAGLLGKWDTRERDFFSDSPKKWFGTEYAQIKAGLNEIYAIAKKVQRAPETRSKLAPNSKALQDLKTRAEKLVAAITSVNSLSAMVQPRNQQAAAKLLSDQNVIEPLTHFQYDVAPTIAALQAAEPDDLQIYAQAVNTAENALRVLRQGLLPLAGAQ